jgi:AraC-like DNA-binding protein
VRELCLTDPNDLNRHSEWDLDFRQIEPGPMNTKIILRPSPGITLVEFNMDRGVHQKGCSPTDTVTIGLPATPTLRSWRGTSVDTPGLLNFGSGSEFDCVTGPGFVGRGVSVPLPLLARTSDQLGLPLPDDFLRTNTLPVRRRTLNLQRLSEHAQALLHGHGVPFGELEQEDFLALLISATSDAEEFDDRSTFPMRAKSVTRAIDLMRDRLSDGVSISQLCADSGASKRTLSRGFRERFGLGPKAYFNCLRLNRVRSELLLGSTTCNIVDTANDWGFWHMGQFAKDYRRMFGELPSETLNGAKSNR